MRLTLRTCTLAAALLSLAAVPSFAQRAAGGQGDNFKDPSLLKLLPGQHASIIEFEDLECPACAHAFPIVHAAVDKYKLPFYRHDFPLPQHLWSRDAAIMARYLQDKVSPELADKYRGDVFAAQMSISSKDDLQGFTRAWFPKHGQQMPFVVDPSGRFAAEVQADQTMGERIGLIHTPSIFVLAPSGWTQVVDVSQLYVVIDKALAEPMPAAPKNALRKPSPPQH